MLRAGARILSIPNKLAFLELLRGMQAHVKLITLRALIDCGILEHLDRPRSIDELGEAANIQRREALAHLLACAVRARLLRQRGDRYAVRSRLAKQCADTANPAIASLFQETLTYHRDVFADLPGFLRGEEAKDRLETYSPLVAQSSRIAEHWILSFAERAIGTQQGRRILEIGCGSGAYLASYASLHPDHSGLGLDMDARVVDSARDFLRSKKIEDRFWAETSDIRTDDSIPKGEFDVVTAYQNVYYFTPEERATLFARCRDALRDDGRLIVITPTSGGPMSSYFALILLSTRGCFEPPSITQLVDEIRAAGFGRIQQERLIPGDAFFGIEARLS